MFADHHGEKRYSKNPSTGDREGFVIEEYLINFHFLFVTTVTDGEVNQFTILFADVYMILYV